MGQELWLLRHGDAEPHGSRGDAERRLTEKGEAQGRAAGGALTAIGLEFAAVLTSPKERARRTAELVAEGLGTRSEEERALGGGYQREDALGTLARFGADDRVLLVGHEPDLSQLVFDLGGGRVAMKKGGIAALRIGRGRGELLALLRPRDLRAMAG